MIHYSKNNAFKVFYPKTVKNIYLEWLLIFVIIFTIASYPCSFDKSIEYRTRSYATEAEMIEAVKILNMVHILIPQYKTNYFMEYPVEYNERDYKQKAESSTTEEYFLS